MGRYICLPCFHRRKNMDSLINVDTSECGTRNAILSSLEARLGITDATFSARPAHRQNSCLLTLIYTLHISIVLLFFFAPISVNVVTPIYQYHMSSLCLCTNWCWHANNYGHAYLSKMMSNTFPRWWINFIIFVFLLSSFIYFVAFESVCIWHRHISAHTCGFFVVR